MRVIAVDDGYFPVEYKGCRGYTVLLAIRYIVERHSVEGIAYTYILVDGVDATEKACRLIEALSSRDVDTVILDGVTYAGFNYIDPYTLYKTVGIPVIVFYRHALDISRIRNALYKNFRDAEKRYSVIEKTLENRCTFATKWGIYSYTPVGIPVDKARDILYKTQLYSPEPEPLRIADKLASLTARKLHCRGRL